MYSDNSRFPATAQAAQGLGSAPLPYYPSQSQGQYPQSQGQYPQSQGQYPQPLQPGSHSFPQPFTPGLPPAAGSYGVPQQTQYGAAGLGGFADQTGFGGMDPFVTGLAQNVLQQSTGNYLQRSQAYVQSRIGFLSLGLLQYYFDVDAAYVRAKLLMLLTPFLRSYTYARIPEQIAGGHKYLPPRQDVYGPDLYIPFVSFCTYCLLCAIARLQAAKFQPEAMYSTVSSAAGGWLCHLALLKGALWVLGVPSAVPVYELLSYSGYTFVPTCCAAGAAMLLGVWGYRVACVYGAASVGVYLVRTLKRLLLVESRGSRHGPEAHYHNYVLLVLWLIEFVFVFWGGNVV